MAIQYKYFRLSQGSIEEIISLSEKNIRRLENCYSSITDSECHVTVYTFDPNSPQLPLIPVLSTYNEISWNLYINETTDYISIFRGKQDVFICNNLKKQPFYQHSFLNHTNFDYDISSWNLSYNSVAVAPILKNSSEKSEKNSISDRLILGFISITSNSDSAFIKSRDYNILTDFSKGQLLNKLLNYDLSQLKQALNNVGMKKKEAHSKSEKSKRNTQPILARKAIA